MNLTRSRKHQIFSERIEKISLSADDDERLNFENQVDTLALEHWKIEK